MKRTYFVMTSEKNGLDITLYPIKGLVQAIRAYRKLRRYYPIVKLWREGFPPAAYVAPKC